MAPRKFIPSQHPRDRFGRFTRSHSAQATAAELKAAGEVAKYLKPKRGITGDKAGPYLASISEGVNRKAVSEYTSGGYVDTHKALRAGKTDSPDVRAMDAAMVELPDSLVLSRRVPLAAFGKVDPESLVGLKVADAAYAPTSIGTVRPTKDSVRMRIAAPAGTRAAVDPDTGEVILDRDLEMVVAKVEKTATGVDMYVTVLPKQRDEKVPDGDAADRPTAEKEYTGRRRAPDSETPAKRPTPAAEPARAEPPAEDEPDDGPADGADEVRAALMRKKLPELRADAKARGLRGYSRLRKSELVDLLVADETGAGEPGRPAEPDAPRAPAARPDAPAAKPEPPAGDVPVEDRVMTAARDLLAEAGKGQTGLLRLEELRDRLDGIPQADVDQALLDLDRRRIIQLDPDPNRAGLTPRARQAAIDVAGEPMHLLSVRSRQPSADGGNSPSGTPAPPAARQPTVGEWLADKDSDASDASVQAITEAITESLGGYTDPASGLSATVDKISARKRGIRVTFAITDADGNRVGTAKRVFRNDGTPHVEHQELELDPSIQGTGFAARFNARNEDFYRAQGIEEIRLTANLDVGGYAWARAGYDWETNDSATKIASILREHLGNADYVRAWPDDVKAQARNLIARTQAAAEDVGDPLMPPNEDMPTPLEFAMLGWTPGSGRGRAAMWPGKQFMLGRSWGGRKRFGESGAPATTPAAPAGVPAPASASDRPGTSGTGVVSDPDPRWDGATTGQDAWYSTPSSSQASTGLATAARRGGPRYRLSDRRRMEQAAVAYSHSPQTDPDLNYVTINEQAFSTDGPDGLNPNAPAEIRQLVDDLQALIGGAPAYRDIAVHRGIQNPAVTVPGWPGSGDATGLEWRSPRFMSTSTDADTASRFARGEMTTAGDVTEPTVMRILVPKGTGALQQSFSVQEVLLGRGHTMRVVADNGVGSDGVRRVDVELVPARADAPAETPNPGADIMAAVMAAAGGAW